MFDDSRWDDSRDDDSRDLSRGSRGTLDARDRDSDDARDVFMLDLDLPRGLERERVHGRDREYGLRESETRTLSQATETAERSPFVA